MSKEAIWKAFAETGEPVYYLLYKELRRNKLSEKDQPDCSGYFGAVPKAIDTEMKREKKQARGFSAG